MSAQPPSQGQQQGLDITTLPVQQLSQLQQRLSQELEHLSNSHARLRAAQARFRDCIRSIQDGVEGKKEGKSYSSSVGCANCHAHARGVIPSVAHHGSHALPALRLDYRAVGPLGTGGGRKQRETNY